MQARPSWHARRSLSALLATVLAGGAVVALLLAPSPPAATASVPAAGISITPSGYGPVQLGPMPGPAGADEHGYCVQARVTAPSASDRPQGEHHVEDPELAAALARHRFATDDLTQAALGYAVHQRQERPGTMAGGVVGATKLLITAATPQAVRDRAHEVLTTAAAEAGPWAGSPGSATGTGHRTGAIQGITLTSATGHPVVGAAFTVTLTGPAVLDATGTRTFSGTTTAQPIALSWTATGDGTVGYEVVFPDAWRTSLTVLEMAGNRQDQLTYGNRPGHEPRELTVPGDPFEVVRDFRPQATTTVQDVVVQDGDPLVDVIEFAAAPGDEWVELDGVPVALPADVTWYGPFDSPQPQAPAPPAGAPVAGVERVVAHGPGRVTTTGAVTATADGFYTAVVTIRKADAGELAPYVRGDFTAPYFEEVETAVNRFDLVHESQTREFNVVPGGRAFDRITIGGYPEDHGDFEGLGGWQPDLGDAVVTVYGPLPGMPDQPEVPDGAPVHWTDTVPAVDGVHEVGYDDAHPIVAPTRAVHPGGDYFVFVYAFAGDDRVEPFVSPYDDVREVFYVPGAPEVVVPPSVVTRAQPDAVVGEPIHDVALVTGTTDPGDHLVFRAFGPQDPAAEPVCDESTLLWTSDPVPVDGAGLYDSGPTPGPGEAGAVYWVETLLTGEGVTRHEGRCGIPHETTLVTDRLAVRTEAVAAGELVAGVEIWDVVVVDGAVPAGATTVVELFHAPEGEPLVCAEPVWTSQPIALTAGDDGIGEHLTDRFTTDAPGTYGFVERTTGADGAVLSVGECGDPSETLVVAAPPVDGTPPAPPGQPLAVTGADVALAAAAAALLLGGGVAVLRYRGRLRRELDATTGGTAGPDDDGRWPMA